MKTIAFLNGYKLILPHYGKLDSLYGVFTTEGFVVAIENTQDVQMWRMEYDYIIRIEDEHSELFYNSLPNEEW
jgi:hypothetical protein